VWVVVNTPSPAAHEPEMGNQSWHRVRAWVAENDPDNVRRKTVVYRTLRHHAATKWFHDELSEPSGVVVQCLGDKLTTVLNHYVRAGEDALRGSGSKLADR
jgi:hypothetical protein